MNPQTAAYAMSAYKGVSQNRILNYSMLWHRIFMVYYSIVYVKYTIVYDSIF